MNFDLTDDQKEFQRMAREFSAGEFAPKAAHWDEEKIFPKAVLKTAGELGFMGIYSPIEVGGLGLSRLDAAIIFEELAAGCTSTTAYITIHNMVTWMVSTFGSEEIKKKYAPSMCSGELLGSYCLTEPGSGSDAASLKTTATLKQNHYIVNGTKAFVSGGGESDLLVVMVRTGGEGPSGISTLLIPSNTKGIEFGKNESKMGWNSQPTRMITFNNVEIPKENLLGVEGQGFKIAMMGLDGGRINIATCSLGAATAAFNHAKKYMGEREQFGKTLDKFQVLRFKLADMATNIVAARNMIQFAAYKLDTGDTDKTSYCAMAKRMATDLCFDVCNDALQIFGGYGYIKEYPLERYVRDCRVHQILEGTNEIMRVIISRSIFKENSAKG